MAEKDFLAQRISQEPKSENNPWHINQASQTVQLRKEEDQENQASKNAQFKKEDKDNQESKSVQFKKEDQDNQESKSIQLKRDPEQKEVSLTRSCWTT